MVMVFVFGIIFSVGLTKRASSICYETGVGECGNLIFLISWVQFPFKICCCCEALPLPPTPFTHPLSLSLTLSLYHGEHRHVCVICWGGRGS